MNREEEERGGAGGGRDALPAGERDRKNERSGCVPHLQICPMAGKIEEHRSNAAPFVFSLFFPLFLLLVIPLYGLPSQSSAKQRTKCHGQRKEGEP